MRAGAKPPHPFISPRLRTVGAPSLRFLQERVRCSRYDEFIMPVPQPSCFSRLRIVLP